MWLTDRSIDGIRQWIADDPYPVLLDGGLSTQLSCTDISGPLWTARAVLEQPDRVRQAHLDFLLAGAEIVITGSYQISRMGFERAGYRAADADDALRTSVRLAREAIAIANVALSTSGRTQRREPLVGASVGPYGAVLHDGSEYRGNYDMSPRQLRSFHLERMDVLAEAQPDLLVLETVPDLREVEVLVDALAEFPHLAATISCTVLDERRVSAGQPIEGLAEFRSPQLLAIGVNCCAPEVVPELMARLAPCTDLPLIAYPNAGSTWEASSERWITATGHEVPLTDGLVCIAELEAPPVDLVGGCCGTPASAIDHLRQHLQPRAAP